MYATGQDEWTIYRVPKSQHFGHHARIKDFQRAWQTTAAFLDEFTTRTLGKHIELRMTAIPELVDADKAAQGVAEARRLFGSEDDPTAPVRRWDYLAHEHLPRAIEFKLAHADWPIMLTYSYSFAWRDLADRQPPEAEIGYDADWRDNASMLGVIFNEKLLTFENRLFLQPTFRFPFPRRSPDFEKFFERVEKACPFRFRESCFATYRPALA
jgi:hypothetical protein